MKSIIRSSFALAALHSLAFANEAPVATKAGKKTAENATSVFTTVRSDVPVPVSKRGGNSEFDKNIQALEVNQSFGIVGKTKEQISSRVSKANNAPSNQEPEIDPATGAPKTVNEPVKDANGVVTGTRQAIVTKRIKEYVAHNVNPATDPDKATVRIFRTK